MKLFLIALLTISTAMANTPVLWDELDANQQSQVLNGQQVLIVGQNPNFWEATYYKWIKRNAVTATPRGSMAVYWDLENQPNYLPQLINFEILTGSNTAAVKAKVTAVLPDQSQVQYEQENTVFKIGNGADAVFTSSFFSTDPNNPAVPGIPFSGGDISFQHFPGDGGGSLVKYHVVAYPIAPLLNNIQLKQQLIQSFAFTLDLHVNKMEMGASTGQLINLIRSLH